MVWSPTTYTRSASAVRSFEMRAIEPSGISTSGPTGSSRSGSRTVKAERAEPSRTMFFMTRLPSERTSRLL